MYHVLFWWIWSLEPWTLYVQDHLDKYLDQTTLCSVSPSLPLENDVLKQPVIAYIVLYLSHIYWSINLSSVHTVHFLEFGQRANK